MEASKRRKRVVGKNISGSLFKNLCFFVVVGITQYLVL